jgi:hypothetical protein
VAEQLDAGAAAQNFVSVEGSSEGGRIHLRLSVMCLLLPRVVKVSSLSGSDEWPSGLGEVLLRVGLTP